VIEKLAKDVLRAADICDHCDPRVSAVNVLRVLAEHQNQVLAAYLAGIATAQGSLEKLPTFMPFLGALQGRLEVSDEMTGAADAIDASRGTGQVTT
jgi:hypothetical protein